MPLFICLFFYMGNLECQDISSQQFSTENFTWDFFGTGNIFQGVFQPSCNMGRGSFYILLLCKTLQKRRTFPLLLPYPVRSLLHYKSGNKIRRKKQLEQTNLWFSTSLIPKQKVHANNIK